ncbi:uncharacterized protein [Nicotiana tomentosiformis]|uniref:uncharacterized protein n=1 Tax=Nicotiana tomentosiformis TaxID=4098 RepID=UPI00388CE41A
MAEKQHMVVQEVAMPSIANVTSSIVKTRITGHFELKHRMIQLHYANGQFIGLPHEDPQQHILNFLEISDTYITNGVTPYYVRLTLFTFSLFGEAKRWLKAEPANTITSWNDLARKVLARFFPSGKTAKIRSEIVAFKQKAGESLYSDWEMFKGLLKDCPHHNKTKKVLTHTFIEGLHLETKIVVDATAGGQVLEKSFDDMNKFSKSNPDWQGEMGRHTVQIFTRVPELDVVSALSEQILTLTNQVNQMTFVIDKQQAQPVQQGQNNSMGTLTILTRGTTQTSLGVETKVLRIRKGHKYLNNNIDQLEQMMKKFIADQQAQTAEMMKKVMADQQAQAVTMRNLERQMGQLVSAQNTRPVGALPSDAEANTKASINVMSLSNGRQLEEVQSKKKKQGTFNEKQATIEAELEKLKEYEKPSEEVVATQPPLLVARPLPPFPQGLKKVKDNTAYKIFLDILKQVQINIPLVYNLQEVPKYAKYIKDIMANKRRLTKFETVALTECSSRIQSKLPR